MDRNPELLDRAPQRRYSRVGEPADTWREGRGHRVKERAQAPSFPASTRQPGNLLSQPTPPGEGGVLNGELHF